MGATITIQDNDMGLKQLRADLKVADGAHTKVGFPSDANISPGEIKSMYDLINIAATHEYGSKDGKIPERSFIRSAYDENIDKLNKIITVEVDRVLTGKTESKLALSRIGEFFVTKLKKKITSRLSPSLSKKTKRGQENGVPLYDTGQLINSITHVEVLK